MRVPMAALPPGCDETPEFHTFDILKIVTGLRECVDSLLQEVLACIYDTSVMWFLVITLWWCNLEMSERVAPLWLR